MGNIGSDYHSIWLCTVPLPVVGKCVAYASKLKVDFQAGLQLVTMFVRLDFETHLKLPKKDASIWLDLNWPSIVALVTQTVGIPFEQSPHHLR